MGDLLIRNVPAKTVAALKRKAKDNGRSLQAEALAIIQQGAMTPGRSLGETLQRLHAEGRLPHIDRALVLQVLREDRAR